MFHSAQIDLWKIRMPVIKQYKKKEEKIIQTKESGIM